MLTPLASFYFFPSTEETMPMTQSDNSNTRVSAEIDNSTKIRYFSSNFPHHTVHLNILDIPPPPLILFNLTQSILISSHLMINNICMCIYTYRYSAFGYLCLVSANSGSDHCHKAMYYFRSRSDKSFSTHYSSF